MIELNAGVVINHDSIETDFMSSPILTLQNEYNVSDYYAYGDVSLGIANNVKLGDMMIKFKENAVMKFNARNLMYCQFLNLRGSMFNHLDAQYLIYLKYIDIAFS